MVGIINVKLDLLLYKLKYQLHVIKHKDLQLFCKYFIENLKLELMIPNVFVICCSVTGLQIKIPIVRNAQELICVTKLSIKFLKSISKISF